MKYLILCFIFLGEVASAACLVQEDNGLCPVGIIQVQAIDQYKKCGNSAQSTENAVVSCEKSSQQDVNDPWYEFLGTAGLAAMSSGEKEQLIKKFFADNKSNMVDEFARLAFHNKYRAGEEIRKLDLYKLRRDYHAFEMQARNSPEAAAKFAKFQTDNEVTLNLMRQVYGKRVGGKMTFPGINDDMSRPLFKPVMVGDLDVSNTDWSDLPNSVRVKGGGVFELKSSLLTQGEKVFDVMSKEILQGKSLLAATRSPAFAEFGFSKGYLVNLRKTVRVATFHHQLSLKGRPLTPKINLKKRLHFDSQNPIHRWGLGLGAGAIVGIGAYVIMNNLENQRQCEAAFPYTPTSYQSSSVPAVDKSMVCIMNEPKAGDDLPNRTRVLLGKPEEEIMAILNVDTGPSSACRYLTAAFNVRFCNLSGIEPMQIIEEEK